MRKVYRIDQNGFYLEDVILNDNEPLPSDCIDIHLPDGFHKPQFVNLQWVESMHQDEINVVMDSTLDNLKQNKLNELDETCNHVILGKFTAQVDGVTYSFSNNLNAQSNFKDAKLSWMDGDLQPTDTIKWTAYDSNGNVVRLQLTKAKFDPVNIARLIWQQSNVSKLRDTLQPQVESAQSQSDIDAIKW